MTKNAITSRGAFLFIALVTGAILLSSFIDYQHTLSTGDHGLVLYAAEATLRGERPFHDYHYFYGPAMPYYYGAFLKIFGNNIISVLIGQNFLTLLSGLLVFACLSLFLNPFLSFTGSAWFWVFGKPYFYTYNHDGIITASLLALYCVFHYLRFGKVRALYLGLLSCLLAGLIKLNFGFSLLLGIFLCVLLISLCQRKPLPLIFYIWMLVLTPLFIILSNAVFVYGLPFYIIRQCYQYFGDDAVKAYYPNLVTAVIYLIDIAYKSIVKSWYSELVCTIVVITGIANIYQIKKGRLKEFGVRPFLLILAVTMVFYAVNLHEFLISGIYFRSFHSFPLIIVFMFLAIGLFARHIPTFVQHTLTGVVLLACLFQFYTLQIRMHANRQPWFYIPFEKAKIFVNNMTPWPQTVIKTTLFLQEHLKEDELFFALPYEPLYYYLVDRKSPNRQLALFGFLNITKDQEMDIIDSLEQHHVNWIVVSNRAITDEIGLGIFGTDYCPLLAQYIEEHFEMVTQFGEWTPRPSWAWHHGTRILKRKDSSQ